MNASVVTSSRFPWIGLITPRNTIRVVRVHRTATQAAGSDTAGARPAARSTRAAVSPQRDRDACTRVLRELEPHVGSPDFADALHAALCELDPTAAPVVSVCGRFTPEGAVPLDAAWLECDGVVVWGSSPSYTDALRTAVRAMIHAHVAVERARAETRCLESRLETHLRQLQRLAHDLRNPLTAVLGTLTLLRNRSAVHMEPELHELARASALRIESLLKRATTG